MKKIITTLALGILLMSFAPNTYTTTMKVWKDKNGQAQFKYQSDCNYCTFEGYQTNAEAISAYVLKNKMLDHVDTLTLIVTTKNGKVDYACPTK